MHILGLVCGGLVGVATMFEDYGIAHGTTGLGLGLRTRAWDEGTVELEFVSCA